MKRSLEKQPIDGEAAKKSKKKLKTFDEPDNCSFDTQKECLEQFLKYFNKKTPTLTNLERFGSSKGMKEESFLVYDDCMHSTTFIKKTINETDKYNIRTLLVTVSAKRACELFKSFRQKDFHPIKLFAKHKKLKEQVIELESIKTNGSSYANILIGIGTPDRVKKLLLDGIIDPKLVNLIVFDMNVDSKKYNVLNHPSISTAVVDMLKDIFKLGNTAAPQICLLRS